ncbi:MAG: prolipoprotein diacylglyceryl transferase [Pseudomonadota bacterium]|nr:prolipoprotein diacylglyceryl transferase [Pseudomonadota bacterium]
MDAEHLAIHTAFDALAWASAAGLAFALSRVARIEFPVSPAQRPGYYAALAASSGLGAYLFGTLNMIACGRWEAARSIEGAIFGAVLGIEIYKRLAGVTARTGARFAAPLAIGIVVGRFGCFFSGVDDFTYGTPTRLPWAHDFGDGVMRHPAPLYESAAMALFLLAYLIAVAGERRWIVANGLYLALLWYAAQRFAWEFVKPYAPVLGPLTLFQLLSLALGAYALAMLATSKGQRHERAVLA